MLSLNEIREKYLKFFEKKGCKIVKSSSLVPDDPTLLFTNAGMVQFKNYYKGIEKPKFTRAVSSQKCVRAGGKHNDLENVGYTARHHTFFEMLGNFSFGDYFKKEAITWAWEFLTKELNIPAEKLVVTVYYNDEEAYDIWKNIVGLPENKIIKISTKDNFWEMGDTGPCGPCSEIFYDHGPEIYGGLPGTPEEDGDRYIEVWNIVFTQFNRNEKGELEELPKKNIDTGMGLERITAVLQGVHNNYDIDLFKKLIDNSKNIIGGDDIFCHRIIADHLRSSAFLICDGVLPSNEGRGYVLRRIMRRAMLQIHKLGCNQTMMYRLVPCIVNLMGDYYTELKEHENLIMNTLKNEEDKFRQTLDKGLKRLDEKIKNIEDNTLSGFDAFELYDTYGFPLDLTEMILKDKNIKINIDEFDKAMKEQKERAKANWVGSGDKKQNELYLKITEDTEFTGYKNNMENTKIIRLIKDNQFVNEVKNGDKIEVILEKTCFYGESGGQVGDQGMFVLVDNNGNLVLPMSCIKIENTIKVNGKIIHIGIVESGSFKINDKVNISINVLRRKQITANHSATHLLHFALKHLLGVEVNQKGSYVDDKRLRFDVSYIGSIDKETLQQAEIIVNSIIAENTETKIQYMNIEDAKKMGAMALFNEKYGNEVRVVSMGHYRDETDKYYSIELCGGCHVKRTGDIGFFKIIKEESIASSVRRIEATTGLEALKYVNSKIDIIDSLSGEFKIPSDKVIDKVKSLIKENKELKKQDKTSKINNMDFEEENYNDIKILHKNLENVNPQDIKQYILSLKQNAIIFANCKNNDKNITILSISKDLSNKYSAVELFKKLDCKGGGVATFAMGNGNIDINNLKSCL